jgi:hypothetical protein
MVLEEVAEGEVYKKDTMTNSMEQRPFWRTDSLHKRTP